MYVKIPKSAMGSRKEGKIINVEDHETLKPSPYSDYSKK